MKKIWDQSEKGACSGSCNCFGGRMENPDTLYRSHSQWEGDSGLSLSPLSNAFFCHAAAGFCLGRGGRKAIRRLGERSAIPGAQCLFHSVNQPRVQLSIKDRNRQPVSFFRECDQLGNPLAKACPQRRYSWVRRKLWEFRALVFVF